MDVDDVKMALLGRLRDRWQKRDLSIYAHIVIAHYEMYSSAVLSLLVLFREVAVSWCWCDCGERQVGTGTGGTPAGGVRLGLNV